MEKFSRFRDAGTGVAPFQLVPQTPSLTTSILAQLRLPFLAIGLLLWSVAYAVGGASRPVIRALGLIINLKSVLTSEENRKGVAGSTPMPTPGDVVVSSWSSALDSLAYTAQFAAVFYVPTSENKGHALNALQTASAALKLPVTEPGTEIELVKVVSQARDRGQVVVVLPERTTTNGRGLLEIASVDYMALPDFSTVFPAAVSITPTSLSGPQPSSVFSYATVVMCWPQITVNIRFARRLDRTVTSNELANAICTAGKLKRLGMNYTQKSEYWKAVNGK